ncbi:LysE family translocator [Methanocella arvoryzae]|uniref:Lysine exporter (LysE family) n=1 Tax=Methanocella arvoryzae (strain DSM 22066 / NBRC 105507 / MRE50) TaxID=351160 RepID=Q0W0M5_METAR|nr:LysE family transporter [Methanocella arvoryzae]CAJ38068.1 putative lysine exporter (LysE family) [Methanocella arvoryzae MRE50]
MLDVLLTGLLIGATHAVPPGPITFEVLKRGITEGFLSAIKVDAGAVLADIIFFILIMLGLLQILNNPAWRIVVWISGCILLLFLGIRGIIRALKSGSTSHGSAAEDEPKRESSAFLTGFLICITSPFAIIWWTGVFAGSVVLSSPGMASMLWMFAGIAISVFGWYALIGASGTLGKKVLQGRMTMILSLICSVTMILFAAILFYRGYVSYF